MKETHENKIRGTEEPSNCIRTSKKVMNGGKKNSEREGKLYSKKSEQEMHTKGGQLIPLGTIHLSSNKIEPIFRLVDQTGLSASEQNRTQ